jgi:hypothetical protein
MAGALAAVTIIAVGVWWASRPSRLRLRAPDIASVNPPTVKQEMPREMEGLRGDVVALARELDDLRRRADLLDARKDVDILMARLTPKTRSSGL